MVEAAIFFPIAVLAAMAVLHLMVGLYQQTCLQAHLHVGVRAEAAKASGKTDVRIEPGAEPDVLRKAAEETAIEPREDARYGKLGAKAYAAEASHRLYGNRLVDPAGYASDFEGHAYALDEAKIVRLRDLADAAVKGGG